MDLVNSFVEFSTNFISSGGILFGFLLVLVESFIPALPLAVFVALNTNAFGPVIGIIISWIATCIGCFLSYLLFRYLSDKVIDKLLSHKYKKRIQKAIKKFKKISFPSLVLIVALPFTPAFLVNIICGIVKTSKRKFVASILIGKIFMVLFWGYVGKSIIESMLDIKTLIIVAIMLVVAYIISKIVNKRFNIE